MSELQDLIIPSNPADRQKLRGMVEEAVNAKTRIAGEQDLIKEIKEEINDQFELPKAAIGKLIDTAYKRNIDEFQTKSQQVVDLYDAIYDSGTTQPEKEILLEDDDTTSF
jgi:hypothetical protein